MKLFSKVLLQSTVALNGSDHSTGGTDILIKVHGSQKYFFHGLGFISLPSVIP